MNAGQVPTRYAGDPRVAVREGGGFTATCGGITFNILYDPEYRWMVCLAPSEHPMTIGGGRARYINNAWTAIYRAIGDPITAAVAA